MKDQGSNKPKFYIYTDGSYRNGVYSGAFCVYAGTQLIYHDSGCGTKAASMNNVAGELSAVMHAALWLKKNNSRAVIVHDYEGCSKWLDGQWRAKNEYTKAYVSFMRPYVANGTVSFKWVKGHNGDLGNAIADVKAGKALKQNTKWAVDTY